MEVQIVRTFYDVMIVKLTFLTLVHLLIKNAVTVVCASVVYVRVEDQMKLYQFHRIVFKLVTHHFQEQFSR